MDLNPVFRSEESGVIEVGYPVDGQLKSTEIEVDPRERELYNQLAAHQASEENSTQFLDGFYSVVDRSGLDWGIDISDDFFLENGGSVEIQPGTAHILNLLFEERMTVEGMELEEADPEEGGWINTDYDRSDLEDIEASDFQNKEFSHYAVNFVEGGSWEPIMVFGEEGEFAMSRGSGLDSFSRRQFIEDRRQELEDGGYFPGFKPDPSVIYSQTLEDELEIEDAEPLDSVASMSYFLKEGNMDPEIYLDGDGRNFSSFLEYENGSQQMPADIALAFVPAYLDSLKVTDGALEMVSGPGQGRGEGMRYVS